MLSALISSEKDISPKMTQALALAQQTIEKLATEVQQLRKQLFGRKTEKVSRAQLDLFAQVLEAMREEVDSFSGEESQPPASAHERRTKKPPKRRALPVTRTERILVPEEERACPECGNSRCQLGFVRTKMVNFVPAKLEVVEYLREKVVCRRCEGAITLAPSPEGKVVENALPSASLLGELTVNKVSDGLPLRRTQKRLKRAGLDLPLRTLNRWEGFAYQLLSPLIARLTEVTKNADIINLDDTGLRVRDPSIPKGTVSGHVWAFVGRYFDAGGDLSKTKTFVSYLYANTWEALHPENFLKGSKAALQGDAYRGYERIASPNRGDEVGRLLAGCCMHARRPFVQAFEGHDPLAGFFVEGFQDIYRVEKKAKEAGLSADQRLSLRQEESLPRMEQLLARSKELMNMPLSLPMKNGVTYFVNQWEKLRVPFAVDGRMDIDNAIAERALRRIASGRKSWLFAGSHNGAERFAETLSLVSSADAVGADSGVYLPNILQHMNDWPHQAIDQLLPHNWLAAREQSSD